MTRPAQDGSQEEGLEKATSHLLEECRMVLPGSQALFGFQWVAVFNQRFKELTVFDQQLHFVATGIIAIAIALVMTPAAYHRSLRQKAISEKFLRVSTRLVLASMFLLATGIAIDFYVVSTLIFETQLVSVLSAACVALSLLMLWFIFPKIQAGSRSK